MATILVVGFFLGFLGVVVFGVVAILRRHDMAERKKWNGRVLMSLGLGLVCVAPFLLGIRVG